MVARHSPPVYASTGLRERKKERTRQSILDTAHRMFAERGFDSVSVADVARAAEVSEATVFNYFKTKEELVLLGLEEFETELLEAIMNRPKGEPALNAFARFILAPRGLLAEDDQAIAGPLAETARIMAGSPRLQAREQQMLNQLSISLAELLAEETRATGKDVRPFLAANAMLGIHRALIRMVRERVLAGETNQRRLSRDVRASSRAALGLLEHGLAKYALRR